MDENRSESLSPRQSKVISILIQARTIEDGAKKAGVSKTTIYKWMHITSFREELTRRKNEVMDVALEDLKTHVKKAVEVLGALLNSDSEAIRRYVANDILTHALKAKELQDIEERLSGIERIVCEKRTYK
jgi:uncharacterized protein YerC